MRSVFLEGIQSEQAAQRALDAAFPDQAFSTKTLFDRAGGGPIGWLYTSEPDDLDKQLGPYLIQGDCTGRDLKIDVKAAMIEALRRVQSLIGGELRDYGD